jgi:hypothetical protein
VVVVCVARAACERVVELIGGFGIERCLDASLERLFMMPLIWI